MCTENACNCANKGHPHAENMIEYGKDALTTKEPWRLWQVKGNQSHVWVDCTHELVWNLDCQYRRKPKEPELIQGYTAEQWQFIIDNEFDCEFSQNGEYWITQRLKEVDLSAIGAFFFNGGPIGNYQYCRPRRTKGVKQPWFGGKCPVDLDAIVVVYAEGQPPVKYGAQPARNFQWETDRYDGDIIAFIEL